ncbi:helix-turn-helix transcriptional regulator [Weizmannia sp. FSL W8-0676]|uniref:helix-turn-helix domain-containing protein n=1 Tax=Weizmannia sp. FSL W8-0676 TaxID=2954703 RepID=UPI00315910A5
MNELHIGKCIIRKRKEKGITQEQLADYMGVSKASVSKWETGQSYPDIVILPKLAAYFNITVDELLGYKPQLSKAEIKKIYHRLSEEFARKPFEETMEEVNQLVKEYYACFPFLLSIAQLLMNYANLAKTEEQKQEVYTFCIDLCRRVKEEWAEIGDLKTANILEALSEIALGHYDQVILLLKNSLAPYMGGRCAPHPGLSNERRGRSGSQNRANFPFSKHFEYLTAVGPKLSQGDAGTSKI